MADISREIQDFRDAVYGEEVRGSMISLAEKVNTESTDAKTAAVKSASDAGAAASNASYAVTQANAAVQSANKAAQNIQDKAERGDFTSTIQIGEVTTGEPGTEASASNSGTAKDAVIDLTIPQGYQGVSMRMAGAWTAGTEYVNNTLYIDLVTYNGSTYGCKRTHTASEAILPTNEGYWQVIAKKGDTGSVENIDSVPITFKEAEERENVETGDTITTVFGKVKKWFSSFKQAAFYDVVNNVLQTEPGQKVLDAVVGKYLDEKKFDISRLVANRNITEPGFAMDGKTLVDWLNELNGNLSVTVKLSNAINSEFTIENVKNAIFNRFGEIKNLGLINNIKPCCVNYHFAWEGTTHCYGTFYFDTPDTTTFICLLYAAESTYQAYGNNSGVMFIHELSYR